MAQRRVRGSAVSVAGKKESSSPRPDLIDKAHRVIDSGDEGMIKGLLLALRQHARGQVIARELIASSSSAGRRARVIRALGTKKAVDEFLGYFGIEVDKVELLSAINC